jgi:hypothetical protein
MTKETAKIAELLTKIEQEQEIDFNNMPREEFNKWMRFIGKNTS